MNDFDKCVESLYLVLDNVLKYLENPDRENKINMLKQHLENYCLIEWQQKAIEKGLYDPQNLDENNEIKWRCEQINVVLSTRMKEFEDHIENFSSHDKTDVSEHDESSDDESSDDESSHDESEADSGGLDEDESDIGEVREGEVHEGNADEGELDEGQGDEENMDVDENEMNGYIKQSQVF